MAKRIEAPTLFGIRRRAVDQFQSVASTKYGEFSSMKEIHGFTLEERRANYIMSAMERLSLSCGFANVTF